MVKKAAIGELSWSEDRFQQECVMWFHNSYPKLRGLLFSVPNGMFFSSSMSKGQRLAYGRKMKLTGLTAGVSDLIFLYSSNAYLLELKRPDGTNGQSPAQVRWQELVESQGFSYYEIKSFAYFREIITNII